MKKSQLALALKIILIGAGLCGIFLFGLLIPELGRNIAEANPEYAYCYLPWLIFLLACSLPCFGALLVFWKIVDSIGKGHPFTRRNSKRFLHAARLALGDSVFFLVGNFGFLFLSMSHPSVLLWSLPVFFVGMGFSVACLGLSTLTGNAAELQEQSDLTI